MAGELNREASELWNSLKPIIDKEIDARTQGVVQRRKAKVTTAPSLVTNTIGVTEPFGTEMFLPFNTNIVSASVGDFVWVEYMYGMTNAFVSMFASADEKDWDVAGDLSVGGNAGIGGNLGVSGSTSLQNTTVNGVLDVTQRRCYALLSSAGWYRVMKLTGSDIYEAEGAGGFIVDFNIVRNVDTANNEAHKISLMATWSNIKFINEQSVSNTLGITKIRTTNSGSNLYVDVYYALSTQNTVTVAFNVTCRGGEGSKYNSQPFTNVAASPSGETVLTEYTFAANITPTYLKRYVDSTAANYTIGSGGYVIVSYPSGLTGNKVVSIGIETWTSNSGLFLICPYGSTNTYWFIIGSSGTTINGIKFVYWYID